MPDDAALVDTIQEGDWYVDILSSVKITLNDPGAVLRCTENWDDEGVPQPDVKDGTGWRNVHYPFRTVEDVMQHFAYNCAVNGIEDAYRLDGWADLAAGAVTMSYERTVEYERVLRPDE